MHGMVIDKALLGNKAFNKLGVSRDRGKQKMSSSISLLIHF